MKASGIRILVSGIAALLVLSVWSFGADPVTLEGYLEPGDTDDMGNALSVSIVVYTEKAMEEENSEPEYYAVEKTGKGQELTKISGAMVSIKGTVKTGADGGKSIQVESYRVISAGTAEDETIEDSDMIDE